MEKSEIAALLQDAYFYALRAMNQGDGTFYDVSRSTALRRATAKARKAGAKFLSPRNLAEAEYLFHQITRYASEMGIDPHAGEVKCVYHDWDGAPQGDSPIRCRACGLRQA